MKEAGRAEFDGLSSEQIREQLERLVRDQRFAPSESLCRFLRYTVEETLHGRGEGLKEYILGREVFGRGSDFDPRIDPIVRVQAGRLRTRLQEYYKAEGSAEEVLIEYPKGSYRPLIRRKQPVSPPCEPAPEPVRPAPELGPRVGRPRRPLWGPAAVAALAVAVGVGLLWRRGSESPLPPPTQLTADTGSNVFPAISRDGRLLVYSSDRAGQGDLDLWVQAAGGGQPVQITHAPGADITPDFSPDGNWIVFRSNRERGGLYLASVFGAEERRLTDTGWRPRYSPDGKWIAYQGIGKRPGGEPYLIPSQGGQPRLAEIRNRIELAGAPIWTPDGSHLVFPGYDQNRGLDWWAVPWQGGEATPLGLARQMRSQGLGELNVDSPPGDWLENQIIFALAGEGAASLWRVPVSRRTWKVSGPARQVTFGTAIEMSPRVSAAGRIVFSSDSRVTHLWGLALEKPASPLTQLTSDASLRPGHFRMPARLSAAGPLVAFSSRRSGNPDVWVKDLSAGKEWCLAGTAEAEQDPLLSPDGAWLAYSVGRSIHVAETGRGLSRKICADCGELYSWVPGGRQLLFGAPGGRSVALYALDITSAERTELVRREEFSVIHAAVSPDRQWVALTTRSTQDSDIHLQMAKFEGGRLADPATWVRLPETDLESMVAWSWAGDRIFYFATTDGFRCLWSRTWDGRRAGPEEAVRHFHTNHPYPWNSWLSVTGDKLVFSLTDSVSNIWAVEAGAARR